MASIYTRTGDAGDTSLFGGGRVGKDDVRVEAYGQVDELNASLGVALAAKPPADLEALLVDIQSQLFAVGAVLATPAGTKAQAQIPKLKPEWVQTMERAIDRLDGELPALSSFVLPGGTGAASALHLARTICRRAERSVVPLVRNGKVDGQVVVYLNRLSDLLFMMARAANHRAGAKDVPWLPPKP